jgi:hypothetical protein
MIKVIYFLCLFEIKWELNSYVYEFFQKAFLMDTLTCVFLLRDELYLSPV